DLAQALVGLVDNFVALALAASPHQPEVAELRGEGGGEPAEGAADPGHDVPRQQAGQRDGRCPRRFEEALQQLLCDTHGCVSMSPSRIQSSRGYCHERKEKSSGKPSHGEAGSICIPWPTAAPPTKPLRRWTPLA